MKKIDPLGYQLKFLESEIRSDGRKFDAYKSASVETNVLDESNHLGSASVRLGTTVVIVGIVGGIFVPPTVDDRSQKGKLNVTCDYSLIHPGDRRLTSLCGASVSNKIELVLNNSDIFDRDQLNANAESFWDLSVNILVVCDDGGVVDCALLAAVCALQATYLPEVSIGPEPIVSNEIPARQLVLKSIPVSFTLCMVREGVWLADPSRDEENVFGRLSIFMTQNDTICGVFGIEGNSSSQTYSMSDLMGVVAGLHTERDKRIELVSKYI